MFTKQSICQLFGHKFLDWMYVTQSNCKQERKCSRCNETTDREKHIFSDWKYVAPENCNQEQKCSRCGETNSRKEHIFFERCSQCNGKGEVGFGFDPDTGLEQTATCNNCEGAGNLPLDQCKRCGKKERELIQP